MQMSSCSVLGAGLRVGATITIHNAHLIYLHGKLEGFGACMRTHCQVLIIYCVMLLKIIYVSICSPCVLPYVRGIKSAIATRVDVPSSCLLSNAADSTHMCNGKWSAASAAAMIVHDHQSRCTLVNMSFSFSKYVLLAAVITLSLYNTDCGIFACS
jgi:hypothetical protein